MRWHTLTWILLLVPLPVSAVGRSDLQQGAQETPQETTAAEEPQPIPEREIPARADVVNANLRRIEALLQPSADFPAIDEALGEREEAMVVLHGELDRIDLERVSARYLQSQRLPWLELRAELGAWASLVHARFDLLQREEEWLRDERARWERAAATADAAELVPELAQRIDGLLGRLKDVEARVRERRKEAAAIGERIAASQDAVAESLERLAALAEAKRISLLSRNAPPLWRALGAGTREALGQDLRRAGEDWVIGLRDYAHLHRGRLTLILFLFVAFVSGSLRLQRRSRGWPAGEVATERARELIGRPVSIALAFTLVIVVLVLPYALGPANDVVITAAAVPLVRLGSVTLPRGARRSLYAVAALAILVRLASLGPDGALLTRIFLLAVTALALGAAVRVARQGARPGGGPAEAGRRISWQRTAGAASAVAAVVLGVALAANIFGWLDLSAMLTAATVSSLFSATAWAVVVGTTALLLPVVLAGPLGAALSGLRRNEATVIRSAVLAVTIIAVLMWARTTLVHFQVWEPLGRYLSTIAGRSRSIGGLTVSPGGIIAAILILVATRVFARMAVFFLREELLPRVRVPGGAGDSMITLANYAIYGVGVVLAASAAGLSGTQVTVVVGALGVGIGFGLQNIVNNFVSGLILMFERPIRVDDTVQTVDHWGTVKRIGIRASVIRSFDGAEIIVPNSDLIGKEVINWTRSDDTRRIEVHVGVAYGTDPESVLHILLRVAAEHPLVLGEPEPQAHMLRFGESSLDFRLRCWTRMQDWIQTAGDLHVAINGELKEAGITIPFPQRDLHLRSTVAPPPLEGTPGVGERKRRG